jgi:D-glycero-alpha-D-manno-heptose 1-phosphate guanylyltransferase
MIMKKNNMEAIILAGGFGRRLQSVIKDVPKPMADVGGRPFLSYVLDYLSSQGVLRAVLSVGYKYEVIQRYFGSRYGRLSIEYVIDPEPLGTGGAIREALRSINEENAVVVNGDTFFVVDIRTMIKFHRQKKANITIALKPMCHFERYGAVIVDHDNRITGFTEKSLQAGGYINGGIYIVNKHSMDALQKYGKSFSFESDFLQKNINSIAAYAFVCNDYFIDIGISSDYKKAQDELPYIARERTK